MKTKKRLTEVLFSRVGGADCGALDGDESCGVLRVCKVAPATTNGVGVREEGPALSVPVDVMRPFAAGVARGIIVEEFPLLPAERCGEDAADTAGEGEEKEAEEGCDAY